MVVWAEAGNRIPDNMIREVRRRRVLVFIAFQVDV